MPGATTISRCAFATTRPFSASTRWCQAYSCSCFAYPRDHVGDRGRAREGNRLHRQFPLHADHQIRIPSRQAASICRRRHGEFRLLVLDGDFRVRGADQGLVSHVVDRDSHLRRGDNRFRPVDLVLHPHTGCRSFCDRDPIHRAGREFFRAVRAGFVALRRCKDSRADIPVGLVSARHRRRLRKGAGNGGALASIAAIAVSR